MSATLHPETLLTAFAWSIRRHAWRQSSPLQHAILRQFGRAKEGLLIGGITEALSVRMPTVLQAVMALERKGLVKKARVRDDRRKILVTLTPKGRRLAKQFGRNGFNLDRLTQEEQATFLDLLTKLHNGDLQQG